MFRISIFFLSFALSISALAQNEPPGHGDHHTHEHAHDDTPSDHSEDIQKALAEGGALVEVEILGMVCDFCATALTKTFGRRDEVGAVQVNLDTKLLSVVIKQGQTMDDAVITELVESAGYKVKTIRRVPPAKSDGDGA